MGKLPDTFAGRKIVSRSPFTMEAVGTEIIIFQDGITPALVMAQLSVPALANQLDKPFEIHRMIVSAVPSSQGYPFTATPLVAFQALQFVGLLITDPVTQQPLVGSQREAVAMGALVRGPTDFSWEWADPFYLPASRGLLAETTIRQAAPAGTATRNVTPRVAFQGYLVAVAPASDRRG